MPDARSSVYQLLYADAPSWLLPSAGFSNTHQLRTSTCRPTIVVADTAETLCISEAQRRRPISLTQGTSGQVLTHSVPGTSRLTTAAHRVPLEPCPQIVHHQCQSLTGALSPSPLLVRSRHPLTPARAISDFSPRFALRQRTNPRYKLSVGAILPGLPCPLVRVPRCSATRLHRWCSLIPGLSQAFPPSREASILFHFRTFLLFDLLQQTSPNATSGRAALHASPTSTIPANYENTPRLTEVAHSTSAL